MKKEELKGSFDFNKPSDSAKKRMLDNIMDHASRKKENSKRYYQKVIPALALTVAIAAGTLTSILWDDNNKNIPPEYVSNQAGGAGTEDAAAPILNQFRIDDRYYILLSDDLRADYGLPAAVNEDDIGGKLADITTSPDKSLIGSEVYSYIPAGGESVVAVKGDNGYQLFRFFTFESYNNNQDEDAVEYLSLYGINKAGDIAKIQFIGHSEQSKLQGITDIRGEITDSDGIARFYDYYSALKNSSDKYFDRLFTFSETPNAGHKGVETDTISPGTATSTSPDASGSGMTASDRIGYGEEQTRVAKPVLPDYAEDLPLVVEDRVNKADPVQASGDTPTASKASKAPTTIDPSRGIMMDTGDGQSGSAEGSKGSVGNALANSITIRIYSHSGIYYDSEYYGNIGFLRRYEVSEDFAEFILEACYDS